ncbi:MAG: hypothetical protein QF570_19690 [Myxococcota bacterium]|jgi:hypothetical protein|nr:hypothetical protein [Myxococcota bacterium]
MRLLDSIRPICAIAAACAACLLFAGSVQAGEGARADATPIAQDAEFVRFLKKSIASKPAARGSPAAPPAKDAASCEAVDSAKRNYAILQRLEADLARLREQQLAKWAEKGWTPKDAAAAGEAVMLNGSGYNIKSGVAGR